MRNNIKERVLEFIKENKDNPILAKDILEALEISYPTLSKYLGILEAEGKIKVSDYGNIKFYYAEEDGKRED